MSNILQVQNNSLTFLLKNKSLLAASSVLSQRPNPMVYNGIAFLDKLNSSDYVDFGKCQDRFGQFSWSKNDSNYLYVKSVQEIGQQKLSPSSKSHNGRGRFQPAPAIEESASHGSRNLSWRGKLVPSAHTNNIQRHGWTTQSRSQGCRRIGQSKQKGMCHAAAVQCGQARDFICSTPNSCKEEGGREVSTHCL